MRKKRSVAEDKLLEVTKKEEKPSDLNNFPTLYDTKIEVEDSPLTDIEYKVVEMFLSNSTKKDIAEKLGIGVQRVNTILSKPKARGLIADINKQRDMETKTRLTGMISESLESRLNLVSNLRASDNEEDHSLADSLVLGKSSLVDVLEKLSKIKDEDTKEEGNTVINFLQSIR